MATKSAVGESKEKDSFKAGVEAAQNALTKAGVKKCDFVLLFATVEHDQEELLRGVRSVTGEAPLSGCSGEGIITQSGPAGEGMFGATGLIEGEKAAAVMVFSSDDLHFFNCSASGLKKNSRETGEEIAKKVNEAGPANPLVLLLFPDGLTGNAKRFFDGLDAVLEKPLVYCGGAAGENMTSVVTYQYHNDRVLTDSASCVLISGKAELCIGVNHGCTPIGLEKVITRAEENRIYEIDNKPAWEFFKQYVTDDIKELTPEVATFLALGETLRDGPASDHDRFSIRIPLRQVPDGSIIIPTEMPTGTKVQMTSRDPENISRGAKNMAENVKAKLGNRKPVAVLQFDCAGRGKRLLGEKAKRMGVDVLQDVFGKDIPWLGFFGYGEIAPVGNKNCFHNYTVAICVIY